MPTTASRAPVRFGPSRTVTPPDRAGGDHRLAGTGTRSPGAGTSSIHPDPGGLPTGPLLIRRGERDGPDRSRGSPGRPERPSRPLRITLDPASAYEAITRQMVDGLREDVAEIKGRLNGLLWLMAGAIAIDIVMRLAGT